MKKLVKPVIATLVMLAMLLSLAACGGGASNTPASSSPAPASSASSAPAASAAPQQKVELRWFMWTGSPAEKEQWETLAKKVTEKYPNITIKFETDTFTNYWDKIQAQITTNSAPDIISLQAQRAGTLAQYNVFEDLKPYIDKTPEFNIGEYDKGIIKSLSYNGVQMALPYDFGPYIIYYNKDLFDKYGVKYPEKGMTWDQFLEKAKALTKDGNYGFVFRNYIDQVITWIWCNGGDIYDKDEKKATMSDPKTVEALQFLADTLYKHKVAPVVADPGNDNWYREQFYAGKIGMYLDGPWNFTNVRTKAKFNWDISTLASGKAGIVDFSVGSGFGINKNSKYKEEAWKAISVILGKEGAEFLAKTGRAFPPRQSMVEVFSKADPKPANLKAIAETGQNTHPFARLTNWQQAQTMINRQLDRIWFKNEPVDKVAKDIDVELQKFLDEHNAKMKK